MRRIFSALSLSTFFFLLPLCHSSTSPQTTFFTDALTSNTASISPLSRAILHILYITKRIEPSMTFMQEQLASSHLEQYCCQEIVTFFTGTSVLKNKLVQDVVTHIHHTHSLEPLIHLWNHIRNFRYGVRAEEKSIILDFTKVYLIAYQALLFKIIRNDTTLTPKITPHELSSLDQIDQVFEKIEESTLSYFLKQTTWQPTTLIKERPLTNLNQQEISVNFAYRFYLNKRLYKAFKLLTKLNSYNLSIFTEGVNFLDFNEGDLVFTDYVIHSYFETSRHTKNLAPILQLMAQFQNFDFIKSSLFIKEFLILLCIIYKDIYFNLEVDSNRSPVVFIKELNELSIEQLLTIIDSVTEKIPANFTTSTNTSSLETWSQGIAIASLASGITYLLSRSHNKEPLPISELIKNEYNMNPDAFINLVFNRYYFIKRLKEIIKVLLFLSKHQPISTKNLPLKPLSLSWQDFIAYKDLNNPLSIEDLIKEIRILSAHFLHAPFTALTGPTLHHALFKEKLFKEYHEEAHLESLGILNDLDRHIEINKIILRFYHVKRLESVMNHLQTLYKYHLLHMSCCSSLFPESPCFTPLHFTQEPIKEMISAIEHDHSFKALFSTWHAIRRYKHLHDEQTFKEFSHFITHLLHSTFTYHTGLLIKTERLLSLEELHNMPLEDILNLLDILAEELPAFLEKNELNGLSKLNWKEWFNKYWLIGPISAVIFGIKLYMMHKGVLERSEPQVTTITVQSVS